MFFVKYRNEKRYFLRYPLVLAIYVLVLLPVAYSNFETHERDGFVSELIDTSSEAYHAFIEEKPDFLVDADICRCKFCQIFRIFLQMGIKNTIFFFGVAAIPIFIFFVPIGIILVIKNKNNLKD